MKRRQLLGVSGLTLTVPFAGCAAIGGTEEESEFTLRTTGSMQVEQRRSEFARSYPGQEPFTEVVLGENAKTADNLHGVEIYNDYENPVEVSLTVNREGEERNLVFEGEGMISTDEYMSIAITRPSTYINKLEVSGDDLNLQKTFDVPKSAWNAEGGENDGLPPEHNVHIQKNAIHVRFVGTDR